MRWISVEDRLPKDEDIVVVKCDYGIVTALFCREFNEKGEWFGKCCCFHEIEHPNEVTHWMPLPELAPDMIFPECQMERIIESMTDVSRFGASPVREKEDVAN